MPKVRRSLSPRDLAAAIGVSESSLKRWVDEGRVRASRTHGGHRRIAMPDAIHFIREMRHPVVRPDLLGLPDLPAAAVAQDASATLYQHLIAGDAAATRAQLFAQYLDGDPLAAICDGPMRAALERIGELWLSSPDGIFIEHRASDLCLQTMAQLRGILAPSAPGAPVAVGCAPSGDTHILPSFLAATVLAGDGLVAVNLGADTPAAALAAAIAHHNPALVWTSVTMPVNAQVAAELVALLERAAGRGTAVVVGGRQASTLPLHHPAIRHAASMAELSAFARELG